MTEIPVQKTEVEAITTEKHSLDSLKKTGFLKRPKIEFRNPRLSLPNRDPKNYLLIALVLMTFFLMAGGLYNLANSPQPMGYNERGYVPVYPDMNYQYLVESLSAGVFFAIGATGIYLMRYATRYAYELRSATSLLALGALLIFIGIVGAAMMLGWKQA